MGAVPRNPCPFHRCRGHLDTWLLVWALPRLWGIRRLSKWPAPHTRPHLLEPPHRVHPRSHLGPNPRNLHELAVTDPTTAVEIPPLVCRWDCEHPRPIEFLDGDVRGQFCPLCGLQRRPGEDWDAPSDPLMDDKVDEMESLLERVLELALDLDAWSGGDEIHNGSDGRRMLMAIRGKLGLPNFFGDWILLQHERGDRIGVVARFLKEHADVDPLERGGGMFPDVSHVRAFILAHRRSSWVDVLADAEEEYRTHHSIKLDGLVAAYWRDADAPDEISNPDETP